MRLSMLAALALAAVHTGCVTPIEAHPEDGPQQPALYPSAPVVTESPLEPIAVYVDPGVVDQGGVATGIDGWRMVTAGVREWQTVSAAELADVAIYEVGKHSRLCGGGETTDALGCVTQIGGLWSNRYAALHVYLISGSYESNTPLVVMHEIGHLLGLTHATGGLMAEAADSTGDWVCPDSATVAALGELADTAMTTSCEAP